MREKEAMEWVARVIDANPGSLNDPKDLLENHLPWTYRIAGETANDIYGRYPSLHDFTELDQDEIALAGGLHDIGRPLGNPEREGQEFHEIKGYWFIRENGLKEGVGHSQEDVDAIAEIMLPHGSVYETFVSELYSQKRQDFLQDNSYFVKKFGEVSPEELIPRNIGQAIVDYAELSNLKGRRVDYRERLEEAIGRYKAKGDPRAECIIKGSERRIRNADFVKGLLEGSVSEEEAIDFLFK